jgi:3-methyladenine DNA glycosylase AlkD
LNDEYIDRVIAEIQKVDKRYQNRTERGTVEYYVKMMLAWTLAEAAINYRDIVEKVLEKIDDETAKMARQKMRDSRRIK